MPTWQPDTTLILTIAEIRTVVADLRRRAARSGSSQMNLAIFHLAVSCGLRATEISLLCLRDIRLAGQPHINAPTLKKRHGRRPRRRIPLTLEPGSLRDLAAWKTARQQAMNAANGDPFICTVSKGSPTPFRPATAAGQADTGPGRRLGRGEIWRRFKVACRALGPDRVQTLTIHHGRHSFITYALAAGHSLADVRNWAGHSSLLITDVYVHVLPDREHAAQNVYNFDAP